MYQTNSPHPDARTSATARRRTRTNVVELNHVSQVRSKVSQLPKPTPVPTWLRSLLKIERGAAVLFGSVFGLSIVTYGYTVHTQNSWKQQYGQLNRIQVQERQKVVMDANLKHQMATAAELDTTNFEAPDPKNVAFIPSATLRPAKTDPKSTQAKVNSVKKPLLGY
jgi:hypothetical protein